MLACKAFAGLLLYPDEALISALPEIAAILRESELPPAELEAVVRFCDRLAAMELLKAQGEYVALFDGAPSLLLYLFGHVHGDSRERGQAMADLLEDCRRMGLELAADELPDYLPVFLEYASLHEPDQARTLMGEIADVVALIAGRLERRGSQYAAVLRAVEALGARTAAASSPGEASPVSFSAEGNRSGAATYFTSASWVCSWDTPWGCSRRPKSITPSACP